MEIPLPFTRAEAKSSFESNEQLRVLFTVVGAFISAGGLHGKYVEEKKRTKFSQKKRLDLFLQINM